MLASSLGLRRLLASSLRPLASTSLRQSPGVSRTVASSRVYSSQQKDSESEAERRTTREYIAKTPELRNLLADIYGTPQETKKKEGGSSRPPTETAGTSSEYEYVDEDSEVIYDVDEERVILERLREQDTLTSEGSGVSPNARFQSLNLSRGRHGVYDIEDLGREKESSGTKDAFSLSVDSYTAINAFSRSNSGIK